MAKAKSSTITAIIVVVALILLAVTAIVVFVINADPVKTITMVEISKNGKKTATITDAEYKYKLVNLMLQFEQAYGITTEEQAQSFWLTPVEGVTQLDQMKTFTLDQIKYEKIEYLKAIESGTKLSQQEKDELQASYDSIEKQFKDAKMDIDDYLVSGYGISFKMYKQFSEQSKIASKFSTLEINNVVTTDQEVLDYYNENIDTYYTVNVRHVLILNTDAEGKKLEGSALEEKKKLAESILEKVNAGENMDALVEEFSEDGGKTENFGYYDVTKTSNYVEPFLTWTMASEAGDTAIVETEYGYHVMKSLKVSTFEDVQLKVKKDLQTKRYSDMLKGWMEEYNIEVYDAVYESVNPLQS